MKTAYVQTIVLALLWTNALSIAMNRKLPNVKLMIQNFGIQKSDQVVLRCLSDPNGSVENEPLMLSPRDDWPSASQSKWGIAR